MSMGLQIMQIRLNFQGPILLGIFRQPLCDLLRAWLSGSQQQIWILDVLCFEQRHCLADLPAGKQLLAGFCSAKVAMIEAVMVSDGSWSGVSSCVFIHGVSSCVFIHLVGPSATHANQMI